MADYDVALNQLMTEKTTKNFLIVSCIDHNKSRLPTCLAHQSTPETNLKNHKSSVLYPLLENGLGKMSQILAVFGATGRQGNSVVNHVLNDSELSQLYKIRAITRDVESENAKQLSAKVEVVHGDILDQGSLETALRGVHTVFLMTKPALGPDALDVEYSNGKRVADVALGEGVEYIIFSTGPPVSKISGSKYTKVTFFDAKAKIEQYIRSLPIKSASYSPGAYLQNLQVDNWANQPETPGGPWIIARHTFPECRLPMIDIVGDTGKFVGAILAEPEGFEGKTLCAAVGLYSLKEIAAVVSKTSGKSVVYEQISVEKFKQRRPLAADMIAEIYSFAEEFGYWGRASEDLVAWGAENARGELCTLEGFFEKHPLQLE